MNIKKNDFVLEIGSGNNPNSRANILADRFLSNNSERGNFQLIIDRPILICDGYKLPFRDNSFDYVICSHILEHMEDPYSFAQEIMRVGKRGYIEVPSIYGERLFGWDFHSWYCTLENGVLTMSRKKEGQRFGGFFHNLNKSQLWFRRFLDEHNDRFYIRYEWEKEINLSVNKFVPSSNYLKRIDEKLWLLLSQIDWSIKKDLIYFFSWYFDRIVRKVKKEKRRLKWYLGSIFYKENLIESIIPHLRCIECSSNIALRFQHKQKLIICNNCKAKYITEGYIPVMLTLQERKKGY